VPCAMQTRKRLLISNAIIPLHLVAHCAGASSGTGWIGTLGMFVSRVLGASWSAKKLISTLLGMLGSTMVLCRATLDEQRTTGSRRLFCRPTTVVCSAVCQRMVVVE
jgi:hypothetical protein